MSGLRYNQNWFVTHYWGAKRMNIFQWDSKIAERIRLKLGWSHYAMYCLSFFKGVALTCLAIWLMS